MAHAILRPSGASRWLACIPSAKLEQLFVEKEKTFTNEGKLAHSLGELLIKRNLKMIMSRDFKKRLAEIEADPLYDKEMDRHCEEYAVYVCEQYAKAQAITPDAIIALETNLDMHTWLPEGFGTGDVMIIADGVLDFIDLKYGKGVAVSAQQNKQMMLYGLGAVSGFEHLYSVDRVRMTIHQPRLDNVDTFEMSSLELKLWAYEELMPKAQKAFIGDGAFAPSLETCQFCKAKGACKALADYNLQLARHDFAEPKLLGDADIVDILGRTDLFTSWIKAVNEYAFASAMGGKVWDGYKLVEGRSNRVYTDEKAIAATLAEKGLAEDKIYTKKLIGITAMEKELGKSDFATYLSPYVAKPAGKPTLVPETDKRPVMQPSSSAEADFAQFLETDLDN